MSEYSLEEFLNNNGIEITEFLRNMDSSQIAYDSFKNFLNKVSPRSWILGAFSFRLHLDRDWSKLANDWSDLVINLDESTKITFFKNKNKIKKIKKIEIRFEE